ncbi:uncharacterized protein BDR25DRAFT_360703 [Lindgomyces ingoldianus]|uniref:Uncharacterized protein n=1 Tax=Lindgomyces ingoldianus TaxID=673940 RepID=A0ACB6QEQ8_9PLEO|nr:uncharacterized protein BDR25DRAFT_360703 [Lindgomyces ingoldianus]KAF2465345.1 hypothetical protein BDR25DRAFT_360703 [Lindgomyces ingoldianus]
MLPLKESIFELSPFVVYAPLLSVVFPLLLHGGEVSAWNAEMLEANPVEASDVDIEVFISDLLKVMQIQVSVYMNVREVEECCGLEEVHRFRIILNPGDSICRENAGPTYKLSQHTFLPSTETLPTCYTICTTRQYTELRTRLRKGKRRLRFNELLTLRLWTNWMKEEHECKITPGAQQGGFVQQNQLFCNTDFYQEYSIAVPELKSSTN